MSKWLEKLAAFERHGLGALLRSPEGWRSLDVDYDQPRVERVWRDVPDVGRLMLHRIHPCEKPLFHPHPWPSAVHVVTGGYEMEVGYGTGGTALGVVATLRLGPGDRYEMADPSGWHSVRPIGGPSLSVMLCGHPWWPRPTAAPKPTQVLRPLDPRVVRELLEEFDEEVGYA